MLYQAFDVQSDIARQTRQWGRLLHDAAAPWIRTPWHDNAKWWSAGARMMMRAGLTFARPAYGIGAVRVGNREVPVIEEPVLASPFGTLLRFRKDIDSAQPKVLVLAPLSGH